MSRPEHLAPPELFYNADEAHKYSSNTRMIQIQSELTRRCLELLALPAEQPAFLLDIGCGSGLSGEELTDAGHFWVGLDISADMLDVAKEREVEGDVLLQDMGHGVGFRPGTFDGVISVSALQWLCNADKKSHGGRAVFQFYPESPDQMELVTSFAMKAGFTGGIVIDFPNSSRAKKVFLVLNAGSFAPLPVAKTGHAIEDEASYTAAMRQRKGKKGQRPSKNSRDWVLQKKERRRKQLGDREVRPDTKYTARRRKPRF